MGQFVDQLGCRTAAGRWLWFLTLTFRTPEFPWGRGFPIQQPMPSPDFVHQYFYHEDKNRPGMIQWIEQQVHGPVEFFVADQFGEIGGRLHLHCGLSWPGLFEYRWKDLQEKLWMEAGFNRILPWKMDAGYYIGRYIGRDAERCQWDFRVGREPVRTPTHIGRTVVARSAFAYGEAREIFEGCRPKIRGWHR